MERNAPEYKQIKALFASTRSTASPATRAAAPSLARALSLPRIDPASRADGETMLAEIAHRLGNAAAESHFGALLELDPGGLVPHRRRLATGCSIRAEPPMSHLRVIKHTRVDPLVLRLGIAQRALRRPETAMTIATLQARFDASRARGEAVHRREEARFQLHVNRDSAAALARANWAVQRGPADLRILAEAAAACGDAESASNGSAAVANAMGSAPQAGTFGRCVIASSTIACGYS